jgi:hypothetical protein
MTDKSDRDREPPACDHIAEWRARADRRAAERAPAAQAEHAWFEQRLEAERKLIFDCVGEVLRYALAKNNADYLSTEVAALWKTMADVHGQIAQIYQDRILERGGTPVVDARKMN